MCWVKKQKKDTMFDDVFVRVRDKMIQEEGYVDVVYEDSLGYKTGGIGHLIIKEDGQWRVGQTIPKKKIEEWFKRDITEAINAAMYQARDVGEYELDFVIALTSVNFQLGVNWPKKWPNTYRNLKAGRLQKVIDSVMGSLWHKQTPKRTTAFKAALLQEMAENNRTTV